MPPKVRQNRKVAASTMVSSPDGNNLAPIALKRRASEDTTIDSLPPSPPKKLKLRLNFSSQRSSKLPAKRETQPISDLPAKSALLPRGGRKTAKVGQKDMTVLRMLCDDSVTGEPKELHFRNMPHSSIDWYNAEHINRINNWRNQIYGRAGMKSKAVILWLEDEQLWFELYYQLSIAEALQRGILLPKTLLILEAFNATFAGHVLKDNHGNDTEPRGERNSNAFASKFNRMCQPLRARLNQCVFGKSGDVYVPSITLEMLHAYKQMKADMEKKGIVKESAYSDGLKEWTYLFSHLPNADDIPMQDEPIPTIEQDAAATLLSLRMPVHHNNVEVSQDELMALFREAERLVFESRLRFVASTDTLPQYRHDAVEWLETPELSFSSSQDSHDWPVTPSHGMDIAALIASPD